MQEMLLEGHCLLWVHGAPGLPAHLAHDLSSDRRTLCATRPHPTPCGVQAANVCYLPSLWVPSAEVLPVMKAVCGCVGGFDGA